MAFILIIILARYLSKEDFGLYTFAIALASIFVVFSDLGFKTLVVREVARDKQKANIYFGNVFIIKIVLSIFTFLAAVIFSGIMSYSAAAKGAFYLALVFAVIKSLGMLFNSIYAAHEKPGVIALLNLILKVLALSALIVIIYSNGSLQGILAGFSLAGFIYLALAYFILVKNFIKEKLTFNLDFAKNLFKEVWPFTFIAIFVPIYTQVEIIILKTLKGDLATGYYGVAVSIISILAFIPANFSIVIYPIFSRLYKESKKDLIAYYEKSVKFLLIVSLPLSMGIAVLAPTIVPLIYGNAYSPSVAIVRILVFCLIILFTSTPLGVLVLAINKQKQATLTALIAVILNIVLSLVLIPRFSYFGSAVSRLVTYIFILIFYFYIISKNLRQVNLFRISVKPVLATLIAGVFTYMSRDCNLFFTISFTGILYFAVLIVLRVFTPGELEIFKSIFKEKTIMSPE